ncbi:MAG: peptide deformylase [Flavobacteriales bacterium]
MITIDTSAGIVRKKEITELPLYDENFIMLKEVMPEYRGDLPNSSINDVAERMKLTMGKFSGLGLSANQCGIKLRAFLIGTDQFQIFCINPKVTDQSAEQSKDNEGCLSFPGLFCKIERPKWVDVEFTTQNGELKQMRLEGLTARCFLHELDHLNGVRFIERIGPVALQMARKKQNKIVKKAMRLNNGV